MFDKLQYKYLFILSTILNTIVQFFSIRKFNALKKNTDSFGFTPSLTLLYHSLGKCISVDLGITEYIESYKYLFITWILSSIIVGSIVVTMLILVDIYVFSNKTD